MRIFAEIERLEWDQAVGDGIVQLAVDACAFFVTVFMLACFAHTFLLQGRTSQGALSRIKIILTEETIY